MLSTIFENVRLKSSSDDIILFYEEYLAGDSEKYVIPLISTRTLSVRWSSQGPNNFTVFFQTNVLHYILPGYFHLLQFESFWSPAAQKEVSSS
jgi:hypothetical protein